MDNFHFSIWTFDRIIESYEESKYDDSDFVPICDYLINAHWFGYIKGEKGIFKDYDRTLPIVLNFTQFLQLLISDSNKLY